MDKRYYKPLPEYLTIKESIIHGLGLFATDEIDPNFRIGVTHIQDMRFPDGYIRTPLGGFFNHSDTPNCKVVHEGEFIFLETIQRIMPGEELTATYTLYNPSRIGLMNSKLFLELIKKECEENGVKYYFPETTKVSYPGFEDMKVSGYFGDRPEIILACAIGKPEKEWLEILVHESCHMDQWKEQSEIWNKIYENGTDCDKGMDEWLNGKVFSREEYTHFVRTLQAVEIDCEKRSVEKINKFNLPIDCKNYIKRANSYLFFYTVMLFTHKWCDVAPYEIPDILEHMPDEFLSAEHYLTISPELLSLYQEKCYKA
jgi:hypothetical protein